MKKGFWVAVLLPLFVQAAQDAHGIRFFVEDGGHMTFSHSPRLFDCCEFIVQRHGVVSVRKQTKKPRITYASNEALDADSTTERLYREGTDERDDYERNEELASRYVQLEQKVAESRSQLQTLHAAFDDLVAGSYDLPDTALSSQDAGRLNRRCAVLEKRFDAFTEWSEAALKDLPLITVMDEGGNRPQLSEFIEKSQNHNSSLGARLHRSVLLRESQPAVIEQNITINGSGHTMTFSGGAEPELIVAAGRQLVLRDITLKNVRSGSIRLEQGAMIRCGEGVVWELHEDLTFEHGSLEVIGGQTVMHMYGIGGQRQITLGDYAGIVLKNNTLALNNISITNAHRITSIAREQDVHGEKVLYTGAIGLCGSARLILEDQIATGIVVAGSNNELICQSESVQVHEPVLFADDGYNELYWHMPDNGTCTLMGAPLMITSEQGQAHVRFKSPQVQIYSRDEAGCVIGRNGMIHAAHLALKKYPFIAVGSLQPLSSRTVVSGVYDNTITSTLPHGYIERKYTAYHIQNREPLSLNLMHDSMQTGITKMQAMQGAVALQGGVVTDWGINPDSMVPLLLELRDGVRIEQGDRPVAIREIDTVTVVGKGNEIVLRGDCSWRGQLLCAEESELTITCDDAALILQSVLERPWQLGPGTRVTIRGTGTVTCLEQFRCHLSDQKDMPAVLRFDDGIECLVMPRATWLFSGKGTVLFDRYSTCDVQPEALVIAGVDEHDDISLVLNRQSQINIGTGEATKPAARLSCAKGRVRLKVLRGAHMSVASGSILELNMRDGVAAPGIIEELCFRHGGALHLAKDSRLLFAENKREPRIRWTQERGGIYGEGLVGMNTMRHNSRLECGVLQQRTFFDKKKSVQTFARNIVASLINLTDSLHSTLYFVNSSETSMIHTKGHVIVPLKPGESIDHDNTSGTVWGTRVSGSKTVEFRLNAQGKPQ